MLEKCKKLVGVEMRGGHFLEFPFPVSARRAIRIELEDFPNGCFDMVGIKVWAHVKKSGAGDGSRNLPRVSGQENGPRYSPMRCPLKKSTGLHAG